jgi:hypothetical protein
MPIEDNPTLKTFEKKLDQIRHGLEVMEKCGIDEEILIAWIQSKTKFSRKDIKLMLDSTEDFYNRLLKKEMLTVFTKETKQITK